MNAGCPGQEGGVVFAGLLPHAPVLIPEAGPPSGDTWRGRHEELGVPPGCDKARGACRHFSSFAEEVLEFRRLERHQTVRQF